MGSAVGGSLPFALGLAIIPIPIVAVILLLFTPRAKVTSSAFLVGWILGVTVATAVLVWLATIRDIGGAGGDTDSSSIVKLVLGVVLVVIGVRRFLTRPRAGDEPASPKWLARIQTMRPPGAFVLGIVLSACNPKNLILMAGGAIAIADAGVTGSQRVASIAVFVVVASVAVAVPVVMVLVTGDRAQGTLDAMKAWLLANNATVVAVLLLVIGVVLAGKGLGRF